MALTVIRQDGSRPPAGGAMRRDGHSRPTVKWAAVLFIWESLHSSSTLAYLAQGDDDWALFDGTSPFQPYLTCSHKTALVVTSNVINFEEKG